MTSGIQTGNAEDIAKYSKRTVRVTQQHNDECKRLLTLMGVPIVNVSLNHVAHDKPSRSHSVIYCKLHSAVRQLSTAYVCSNGSYFEA